MEDISSGELVFSSVSSSGVGAKKQYLKNFFEVYIFKILKYLYNIYLNIFEIFI